MQISIYHIDAFASKLFTGNPAAVCILDHWLPGNELQTIAMENYLPATAFLVRINNEYHIRWFAPEYEIDLCGHGSLAAAYIIFNVLELTWNETTLHHPSGLLKINRDQQFITLHFPAKKCTPFSSDQLIQGLGLKPSETYQFKTERCLAVFKTEEEVRQLNPDMQILKQLDHRGIIVTAPGEKYDFISRTFYPRKAACEDAITGSSHCLLIPYWSERLNKKKLNAFQASQRGGELFCEDQGGNVLIRGDAIIYMRGEICY